MGSKGSQSSSSSQSHILTIQGAIEIRVARVVGVAAVVKVIFSHTGGYGNTDSKGSQSSSSSQTHILTIHGAMEIRVARVVRVAAVVRLIFSQYRGLWKYG